MADEKNLAAPAAPAPSKPQVVISGDEARAIVRAAHPGGSDHPTGIDYVRATVEYLNRHATLQWLALLAPAPAAQAGYCEKTDGPCDCLGDLPLVRQSCSNWQQQQSATPPECTCPSGNGSLRHPCPVHAVEPVARIMREPGASEFKVDWLRPPGPDGTSLYATPADAASEADKRFHVFVTVRIGDTVAEQVSTAIAWERAVSPRAMLSAMAMASIDAAMIDAARASLDGRREG